MTALRDATAGDANAVCDIINYYTKDSTVTFNEIAKTIEEVTASIEHANQTGLPFLVLCNEAGPQGFATCTQFRKGSGYRFTSEVSIMLAPGATGKGWGGKLLQALEHRAAQAGANSLIAGISADNQGAIKFYTSHGFSQVGCVPQAGYKFNRWIDLILLQKRLSLHGSSR